MTGNKSFDTILTALLLVATLGALGTFIYTEKIFVKPLPDNAVEEQNLKDEVKESSFVESFELGKQIINLKGRTKRLRFLEVECHFRPFKDTYIELLEKNKPFINDSVIDVVGSFTPNELNSVSGKILLEERLKNRLNEFFNKPIVKEIYFSRFVVQ